MKKFLPLVALVGLTACTVYPNGATTFHPPTVVAPAPIYVPPPVYVAPRPYYYTTPYAPWRTNPYRYNYHHYHHRRW